MNPSASLQTCGKCSLLHCIAILTWISETDCIIELQPLVHCTYARKLWPNIMVVWVMTQCTEFMWTYQHQNTKKSQVVFY